MKVTWVRVKSLPGEHGQCVVKDVRAALDALIAPGSTVAITVDGYRESLAAAVVHGVNEGNVELVRMLSQMVGSRHANSAGTDDEDRLATIPGLVSLIIRHWHFGTESVRVKGLVDNHSEYGSKNIQEA